MSADDALTLLGPRHVDALTEALRATTIQLVKAGERERAAAEREHRMLAALERIAGHTENLPALMDALVTKHTNGNGRAGVVLQAVDDGTP